MEGYAKVARLMTNHTETACLRGFKALSCQNLLYLQAELIQLEADHETLATTDRSSGHPKRTLYEKSYRLLSQSHKDDHDEQFRNWLQIRAKLKEYYTSLEHHIFVSHLSKPSSTVLEFINDWFARKTMGGCPLLDIDRHAWDKKNETDIITLRDPSNMDIFSHWFCEKLIPMLHSHCFRRFKKPIQWDPESGLSDYSDSAVATVLDLLGTVISSLFPVSSIAVLYSVTGMSYRIGIVAGFTALFSLTLALITKGRRVEIFAATTA
ncbi:uncharacterized protein Z518_06880 [Rhinocladiella mackenziei CBS 650.93]|uniref:Rhinocladiella mackenziei CBS 650.93 unplaced genomic scaffold supercont1.5, whole genome shotgun sequence n=1 Tax=Rhinocladiella mackenziei CBS 650.93 TaxID=1442369 RepID=A0A0D2GYR0_9EURO|nr:uncharacterized protein Z518_06880 [Rhinocladiella mackenziei CBS 650.93]KIX03328.1 hypothetical protein Z518_06880 [Rhinocladiella mackenziei CBS 650.93]